MIEFNSLDLSFGKKRILNGVSLSAPDGQITVILGKNGSGKTTLLRSVFLTRGASLKGKILINGKSHSDFTSKEFSKSLALMPQNLPAPKISVRELVRLGRSPYAARNGADVPKAGIRQAISSKREDNWNPAPRPEYKRADSRPAR